MAYTKEKWTYEACLNESKKYKTRTEFKKGCVGAYDKSCKQKWIDDFTWLASPSNKKYTYEEVKAIAEQFDSLAEFTKQKVGAYQAALNNGWLDSFTHFKRRNKDMTSDDIIEYAKGFNSYSEFIKSDATKYNAFLRFYNSGKIKDEDLPWEVTKRKSERTYEDCYNEAKKYDSPWHFKLGNNSAYNRALKEDWIKDYTWFEHPQSQYDYDTCKRLSEQFKNRAEFQKECSGAYSIAARNGWLDDFDTLEPRKIYTVEEVLETCKRIGIKRDVVKESNSLYNAYLRFKNQGLISDEEIGWKPAERLDGDIEARIHSVYVYDFGNKVAYVGRTYNPHRRDLQHRRPHHAHGKDKPDSILQYSIDSGIPVPEMTILEDELNMQESRRQEDFWYNHYKELGYTLLNSGATGEYVGSVGGYARKWTRESVIEFAKQFDDFNELKKANDQASRLVKKWDLVGELFPDYRPRQKITFERAKEAAASCKTKGEFHSNYGSIYGKAVKEGWLDILFPKSTSRDSSVSSPEALF